MLGTRHAAVLFARVAADGGRVLLIGDGQQAPPIDAGGVWTALCHAAGDAHIVLVDACRQHDPAERDTVNLLRAGGTLDALRRWNTNGRVISGTSDDAVIADLAVTVAGQLVAGDEVLVLAATRDDAERAGFAIRQQLLHAGALDGEHRLYGTQPLAVGDRVVLRRNDRQLGARNGTRGTVQHLTPRAVTIRTAQGQVLELPASYAAEHVRWAYALTVHTGQGQTADHVHVLAGPNLYRELAVVGSRHRHTVTWHSTAGVTEHLRGTRPRPTLTDVAQWASTPRAERFAEPDHDRTDDPPAVTLAELYDLRDQAVAVVDRHRRLDWAAEHAQRALDDLHHRLDLAVGDLDRLEHQRQHTAARLVRLPQRPLRRTTRHALRQTTGDLERLNEEIPAARLSADDLREAISKAARTVADARDAVERHRPAATDAARHHDAANQAIRCRLQEFGLRALRDQPAHIVRLIGAAPTDLARRQAWVERAGRLEGYLERWDLPADALTRRPASQAPAHDAWQHTVAPLLHRGTERQREAPSLGIDR